MKISVENLLDKLLKKLNLKKINNENKGKVIKFENNVQENNQYIDEKKRKGAVEAYLENNNEKKVSKQGIKILTSMILLLLLTISITYNTKLYNSEENIEPKEVSSVATVSSVDNFENNYINSNENEEIVLATKATEKVVAKKVEEKLVFSKPLDGDIQKMYSTDKVIYSKTLAQWKTHDGLDISASSSKEVKAIEKGVVEDVYDDSFYGKTIVIEHINGYRSEYSNLDENVFVNIGESVVKGQKIGKVGNTAVGEYLDDEHLHFMIFLNDKSINPTYLYD
jgi:murein DD-endopeptidase MepM/ murein hydrolase activator NlpD